jgi:hypothetical protein
VSTLLTNPNPFPERILFYADGGGGKTTAAASIAAVLEGNTRVIEHDYSAAWSRVLALQFPEATDRVEVETVDGWEELIDAFTRAVDEMDPTRDMIVIDSASPISYEWVQEHTLETVYGDSLSDVLMNARKDWKGDNDKFKGARLELMQWDLVKKEYRKFWRLVQKWKGHMVLTAEAKQIGYWDKDDADAQRTYGKIGFYPAGQDKIRYAMATTLFLNHPKHGEWRMTTVKDRGRVEQDREPFDNFALDYLVGVAGWVPARRVKRKTKAQLLAELGE